MQDWGLNKISLLGNRTLDEFLIACENVGTSGRVDSQPFVQLPAFPVEIQFACFFSWGWAMDSYLFALAGAACLAWGRLREWFCTTWSDRLELALCLSIEAHRLLPIVCKSADSSELLEHVEDMADAREHKVVHTDQPNTAMLMWTQFMSWCDHASAPKYTRKLVSSYIIAGCAFCFGKRLLFPHQQQVIALISSDLHGAKSYAYL